MQKQLPALLLALLLGACTTSTTGSSPQNAAAAPSDRGVPPQSSASMDLLSVLGTPFLIAFKIPVCAATLIVAAPTAGMSEAVTNGEEARRVLADGVSSNCGPPYAVPSP